MHLSRPYRLQAPQEIFPSTNVVSVGTTGWMLDTGCIDHCSPDRSLSFNYQKDDGKLKTACGETGRIWGRGDIRLDLEQLDGSTIELIIRNVIHAPVAWNLISTVRWTMSGGDILLRGPGNDIHLIPNDRVPRVVGRS